jgi:uncharacterized surface protein with fasciclin (FAS1) repeats
MHPPPGWGLETGIQTGCTADGAAICGKSHTKKVGEQADVRGHARVEATADGPRLQQKWLSSSVLNPSSAAAQTRPAVTFNRPLVSGPETNTMLASNVFGLLSLIAGSLAQSQSLLDVLRREGFTEYAALLEGGAGVNILNSPQRLIIYAPTNAGLLRHEQSDNLVRREITNEVAKATYNAAVQHAGDAAKRRRSAVCSDVSGPGAADFMTLLNNPEFVNLPLNNNASIVQKNMPKGALPVVHSGLGDVVKVTGLDIPYDRGIIRPVSAFFTLPRLLSFTLPHIGADKTLAILQRTGLISDLDTRTGITFLAPDNTAIPSNLPDNVLAEVLKRHVIVGLPLFTSDLRHGDTYRTLAGTTVTVAVQCGEVFIGGARILAGDAIIKNGVAHTVDKVRS